MSQFVLDDQLQESGLRDPIRRWATADFLRAIQPDQVIKDERIPAILRRLRTPTFVTIDQRFWNRVYRDRRYCMLFFALKAEEQGSIPTLVRQLVRLPEFRTRAARMGKVARVSHDHVVWWQIGDEQPHRHNWASPTRPPTGR